MQKLKSMNVEQVSVPCCCFVNWMRSVYVMMNWGHNEGKGITQGRTVWKSPLCVPAPTCVVLACPDGWGLKDANVHVGAADLPQRLTLHQWKWKPVNQQAAVALVPAHHSLWHCQPRQEHINHKHRPKHCAVGRAVSHPFIHLVLTLTHTTYTQMRWTCKDRLSWMPKSTSWHTYNWNKRHLSRHNSLTTGLQY